jgi:zinc transport system substrate-binding protein
MHCRFIAASILALPLLAGCGGGEGPPPAGLTVAVSIPPQVWLVERIGGARVSVLSILSSADSPHTYQPTDAQISRILQTRLYLRMGVAFEQGPWFAAIRSAGRPVIVDQREGVSLQAMAEHHHEPGEPEGAHGGEGEQGLDPHIWLSPRRLKIQAATVARALSEADPGHAAEYCANLEVVLHDLDELDARLAEQLAPARGRTFLVFHPAWGYFAADYGLVQEAIEIEGKEPSDSELTAIQRLARERGIRVIFVQPQIAGLSPQAVARVIGARLETLDPMDRDLPGNLVRAATAIAAASR